MWSLIDLFPEEFQLTVLDIGAALSEAPSYQQLVDTGKARIIGFEPDAAECEKLNQTFGAPHRFYPYFLGDGEEATFFETNLSLTGSLYEPNLPLLSKFQNLAELTMPVAQHKISTKRVDEIEEIDDVDFIKIDIQGGELNVFKNAERILASTMMIQTEVEFVALYKDQPMFSDVDAYLRSAGFQFHTFHGFGKRAFKPLVVNNDINQAVNQLIWSDAIYVRDWLDLSQISREKLRSYAILAHDLIGSWDLAHLVLQEIDRRERRGLASSYRKRFQQTGNA